MISCPELVSCGHSDPEGSGHATHRRDWIESLGFCRDGRRGSGLPSANSVPSRRRGCCGQGGWGHGADSSRSAAIEKRRHDRLAWNRRTLQGAYDEVGKRDARWDVPARKAMDLAARMFSGEADPEVTSSEVYASAKAAVDAGCDDPILVYLHSRSSVGPNDPGKPEAIRRARESARALAASRYPAFRRAVALQISGVRLCPSATRATRSGKTPSVTSTPLSPCSGRAWPATSTTSSGKRNGQILCSSSPEATAHSASPRRRPTSGSTLAWPDCRATDVKVLRLLFRGIFWFHYGWEARTNAFAPGVPAGGFEALEERLAVARKALDQAWQLQPGLGVAAQYLIEIDKAIGGDRATMELWFDRAMKANGDDRSACWTKLDWLDPKWHGTPEEMLAFGRACRDTKNWRTGITLLVADAHWRIACELGGRRRSST